MSLLYSLNNFWRQNERISRMRGFYLYVKEHGFPRLVTSYYDADGVANPVMKQIFREVCLQFGSLGPPRSKGYVKPNATSQFGDFLVMEGTLEENEETLKEAKKILESQYKNYETACARLGLTLIRPLEFVSKNVDASSLGDPHAPPRCTCGWKATWCI